MKNKVFYLTFFVAIFYLVFSLVFFIPQQTFALESGWNITAPASVTLPSVNWSLSAQTTTVTFGSEVVVSNESATSQGFTVQVTSTELIHTTEPSLFMGYSYLEIKTGALNSTQPNGVSTPIDDIYTAFSGSLSTSNPIDIMVADVRSREPGSWAVTPNLRLSIPAKQKAGTYQGTLTFTIV